MRRTTRALLVGAVLAVLAIGTVVPTAIAASGTDTQAPSPYGDQNATEVRAQQIAYWMETRMGPDGVAAFEDQTGVTVETVAGAMAEHMVPWGEPPVERGQYGPDRTAPGGYGPGGDDTGPGGYGSPAPCHGGHGHRMGGHGPGWGGGW
jgi:hypothetical protein